MASRAGLGGLLRLVHPFPILLDAIAAGAFAWLAAGEPWVAARLAASMLALQASIGALNDIVDAPLDAGRKLGKPIPSGSIGVATARGVVVAAAGLGVALAVPSGPGLVAVAVVVLATGYAYDLRAKGTAWSWLPFAVGIPLLPVFGWYGAAGQVPDRFAILIPTAILAGAALAIANALADADRDRGAGVASVALWLGPRRAWRVGAVLDLMVVAVAVGSLWAARPGVPALAAALVSAGVLGIGAALGRAASPSTLERAWEAQAVGIALLAVSWLWGAGA